MSDPTTANSLFTALTLVANVAFLALLVVGLLRLGGDSGRRATAPVVAKLGPVARPLALVVAAVTTLGSLYYSEIVGFIPCDLCWYQRVLMYPLAAILAVGVIRRDRAVFWYAAPFVVLGAPLALYHWLVERVPSLAEGSSCAVFVPCSVPYFEELGYVTLAFMDLSAFLLIGALLLLGRANEPHHPDPDGGLMHRPTRTLLLVVTLAIVGAALVASPAVAGGNTEIGTRVKVQGTKLPTSDDIGGPDDPAIGMTVPTLTGKSLDGKKVTLANDGTPRIMIFLSHSCPHCQAEVPVIVDLAKKGKLDGVEVQTVTTNTSEDLPNYPPSAWLEDEKWPFEPVLADDAKLRAFFGMGGESFPYFVLIDADGKVVARASGELPAKTISTAAKRLAAGEPIFTS